jgi:hypothetical protein
MLKELLISAGPLINQSLSAAIATIAGSFFLYSLVKGIGNRVARVYSLLLLFVLITYIGDLGVGISESDVTTSAWLRFQWLGIAFVPATYANLGHVILSMTGLKSRGRRRWTVRALYLFAGAFLLMVVFSDLLVTTLVYEPAPHFQPGPLFLVFVAYFFGSVVLSFWFLLRARKRTLVEATHRRFTYLMTQYLAPALAVFPFLLVSGQTLAPPLVFYGVLTLVDAALAVMFLLMSYAMAFVGSVLPDRMIKAQLLQFLLRGPVVAIVVLGMILWIPSAGAVLGLPGHEAMPLLVVATILLLQWFITIIRPMLERRLIYVGDQGEIRRIQELEERLLTGADFHQMLDTILMAVCDYVRVETAFVASLTAGNGPRLERAIGLPEPVEAEIESAVELSESAQNGDLPHPEDISINGDIFKWHDYWLIPLHAQGEEEPKPRLIGLLGVSALVQQEDELDEEQWSMLMALASRAAEVLEDRRIQAQVFASLEGLLPEMTTISHLREATRHGGFEALATSDEEMLPSPDFSQKIKDALSHYWGGPQLTDSALLRLAVVRQELDDNDGNPQRAMRAVLQKAIESLRPEGQRSMTTAEWILYNILEMRFIQGRKVRDVALRLAMSESDLYRKQRVAIEAVAAIITDMEHAAVNGEENGKEKEKNS